MGIALILGSIFPGNAQVVMNGPDATTCSDTFTDSNPNGNYSTNESDTLVICPDMVNGNQVRITFTAFDVQPGDVLTAYEGPNVGGGFIGNFDNNNSLLGTTIEANFANGGCLTFVFSSDGTGTAAGWSANITCSFACQDVVPNIASTVPTALPTDTGWIDLCPGDSVVFSGSGVYPQSGMPNGYTQSDATSTFIWDFGDGNLDTAQSATHVYNGNGGWLATLTVIDSNGCRSDTLEQRRVRVSTEPSFNGLVVEDNQLCLGDTTRLIGTAKPTQGIFAPGGVITGTTFLPDGNGVAYTTSIIINSFSNNDTITDATDILDICATIEHSFLGDLEIVLTCPNGTSVILKDFPGGGGVFFGPALDDGTNITGIGWEYCWTNTPTFGTMNAEANGCPNCIGNSLAPGSYATIEPLSNFIGCPLNGTWTLTVIDSLSIDNGYIFSWGMTFNPALFSGLETFTPVLDTMFWQSDPDIVNTVADTAITIVPTTPGFKQYTFTVIDDFGCSFDTTVSVFVQAPPPLPTDTFACAGDSIVLDAGPNFLTYAWSTGATTPAISVT
ncbi:MAG: PKD domain-containing protein, partial [Bacteroidota bacterium]